MHINVSDQAIRDEALNPTRSFIVQAPAGSGKTALLMQRFLVLLTTVDMPEECLAITFTRKAAHEMRDRIISALMKAKNLAPPQDPHAYKTWNLAKQVLKRDQELGWNLLLNPSRLKIQTIDALCASLTRKMPIISGLGVLPEVQEYAYPLYETAAGQLLEAIETDDPWSEALRFLILHLDNNLELTKRLLAGLLPKRDQWLSHIGRTYSVEDCRAVLEQGLQCAIQEALIYVKAAIPKNMDELLELAEFSANHLCETRLENESLNESPVFSPIIHCKNLLGKWPEITIKDLPMWLGLAELLLTQEGSLRKTVTAKQGFPAPSSTTNKSDKMIYQTMKNRMLELLSILEETPGFREALLRVKECPPPVYSDEQWQIVEALIKLLPVLSAQLTVVFQEQGQVDFTEIAMAACRALGELDAPSDLALGLDYRIQHILVDEFQDTSISQFRLLELLTAGWGTSQDDFLARERCLSTTKSCEFSDRSQEIILRSSYEGYNKIKTLFLVGDPQQSIYRFRQAEVGLFIAVKQRGINGLPIHPLTLTVNFRSDPKLIHWLNDIFSKSFPEQDDIVSGAVRFSPCQAVKLSDIQSEVSIHLVSEQDDRRGESEARHVVHLIEKARENDPNASASIAILVRSRTHLMDILPQLRKSGIAYEGIDLELLSGRPIIQDLLALTRALLHLGDRIAWLAVLRFPWIALSLSDLNVLAKEADTLPLWCSLSRYLELITLSLETKEKLDHIVPILKKSLYNKGRISLRAWVTETWIALQGHQYLYDDHSLQDAEAFFEILDELEQKGGFEEPGVLEEKLQILYSKSRILNPNAVQIMTIHKAKGLEFDIVILPGLGRKPRGEESQLLLWEERTTVDTRDYLIFAPIKSVGADEDPVYTYLKKEKQRSAEFEALRLLYVAATRARRRLYWITHKPEPNSLLSMVSGLFPEVAEATETTVETDADNSLAVC